MEKCPAIQFNVVAIEKRAFKLTSTKVANYFNGQIIIISCHYNVGFSLLNWSYCYETRNNNKKSKHFKGDFLKKLIGWLVGWVYGISTFVGYLMPNSFLYK